MADWNTELSAFLQPFLDKLGHKKRRQMCPLYLSGLIGSGDRKSIEPMAERFAPGQYDRLHHFISDGVWDAAPLETELARQADRIAALLKGQSGGAVLADKAYDSNALRETIADMGAVAVIPPNRSRKIIIPHDGDAYKHRNLIERCFNRMKHFRRFATRYDRRTIHFEGFVNLAAATIWLR